MRGVPLVSVGPVDFTFNRGEMPGMAFTAFPVLPEPLNTVKRLLSVFVGPVEDEGPGALTAIRNEC